MKPTKRSARPEPLRRGRALVVLRNRLESYAEGGEASASDALPKKPEKRPSRAEVQAHLLGQDGQKRGLKGGQEVLEKARSTYLEREYSGRFDRRPRKGRITKTEV